MSIDYNPYKPEWVELTDEGDPYGQSVEDFLYEGMRVRLDGAWHGIVVGISSSDADSDGEYTTFYPPQVEVLWDATVEIPENRERHHLSEIECYAHELKEGRRRYEEGIRKRAEERERRRQAEIALNGPDPYEDIPF